MHNGVCNRFSGGKQLHKVRGLFLAIAKSRYNRSGQIARNEESEKPPDVQSSAYLFVADTKQSRHPIEPKSFPVAGKTYPVWKDTHLFCVCPSSGSAEPQSPLQFSIGEDIDWLEIEYHGVQLRDDESRMVLHHYSINYYWPRVQNRLQKVPVSLLIGGFCHTFIVEALSPNRTHVPHCVPSDHFLCCPASLLEVTPPTDAWGSYTSAVWLTSDAYGLEFPPREYGTASISKSRRRKPASDGSTLPRKTASKKWRTFGNDDNKPIQPSRKTPKVSSYGILSSCMLDSLSQETVNNDDLSNLFQSVRFHPYDCKQELQPTPTPEPEPLYSLYDMVPSPPSAAAAAARNQYSAFFSCSYVSHSVQQELSRLQQQIGVVACLPLKQ